MGEQAKKPSKKQQKQHKQEEKPKEKQKEKPKEKPKEKESSQEDEAGIDLNQLEGGMEQMEVSFLVGQIQEDYYHSLKTILLRYAHITKTTNAELADALVANRTIGNVVLADDDEEQDEDEEEEQEGEDDEDNVYSVLSILSGKSGVGKKIRSIVLKSIEKKDFPEEVSNILMDPSTSVLLNERLPNLPAFVATSSHQVFKKDLLELKHRSAADSSSLLGGYLLNVSEVQFEGEEELDKLIYSKFQDFEMCQRARVWWLGGNNPSHRRKADMRSLYYLITPQEYLLGVDRLKTYLAE